MDPIASEVYRVGASMSVEYTEMVLTIDVPFYAILALLLSGFAFFFRSNWPKKKAIRLKIPFYARLCLALIQALVIFFLCPLGITLKEFCRQYA